jgi:glycosyltransferase involved in cell wall biosynthesis
MIIINTSEENTGIFRYISKIGLPIVSLKVKDGNFDGVVFEKRIKYIPFSLSLKYANHVFIYYSTSLKKFVQDKDIIYASQSVPVVKDGFGLIHDVLTLKYHRSRRYKKYLQNNIQKMKDFKGIVTVSNHTKNELMNLGFDEKRIDVIYPYISDTIKPINKSKEEIRKELHLPINKKIIINVSGNTPNKANDELPIIAKLSDNFLLIHVGPEIKGENILNYQNIDDLMLSKLYQASDVYISTSLGEGFGLPPIEAQRFGLPVIARKLDVFDETMGDSYINLAEFTWVEECDIDFKINNADVYWQDWKFAIEYAVNYSEEYAKKGIENAKKYTEEIFKERWERQIEKWRELL